MSISQRDRIVGFVLLTVALIWTGLVYRTIPPGDPGSIGPRAFPLLLGILLAGLSVLLVVRSFIGSEDASPADAGELAVSRLEVGITCGVFLLIILYGYLLERLGFRIATAALVAAAMVGPLKIRNPLTVVAFSLGIAVGCWLIFNKLLGTYMPYGTWTAWS